MSDTNHNPVTLSAGSHDYDKLKSGLGKASRGSEKNYQEAVDNAVSGARDAAHEPVDPRAIAGYKFVKVENKELGITETVQVYDPDLAAGEPEADKGPSETELVNTQTERAAEAAAVADGTSKE